MKIMLCVVSFVGVYPNMLAEITCRHAFVNLSISLQNYLNAVSGIRVSSFSGHPGSMNQRRAG